MAGRRRLGARAGNKRVIAAWSGRASAGSARGGLTDLGRLREASLALRRWARWSLAQILCALPRRPSLAPTQEQG